MKVPILSLPSTYITMIHPPPLSKVRPSEEKSAVRTEGLCLKQGRALGTNSLINAKVGAKKVRSERRGGGALDKGVPWTTWVGYFTSQN